MRAIMWLEGEVKMLLRPPQVGSAGLEGQRIPRLPIHESFFYTSSFLENRGSLVEG